MHLYSVKFINTISREEACALVEQLIKRFPCEYAGGCRLVPWLYDTVTEEMVVAVVNTERDPDYDQADTVVLAELTECMRDAGLAENMPADARRAGFTAAAVDRAWTLIDTHRVDGMFNPRIFEQLANINFRHLDMERVIPVIILRKITSLRGGTGIAPSADVESEPTVNGKNESMTKPLDDDFSQAAKPRTLDDPGTSSAAQPATGNPAPLPASPAQPGADAHTAAADPGDNSDAPADDAPKPLGHKAFPFGGRRSTAQKSGKSGTATAGGLTRLLQKRAMEHPALRDEADFVRRMYQLGNSSGQRPPVFAYLADTGHGEYSSLIAGCLMDMIDDARSATHAGIESFKCEDFKAKSERYTEGSVDYDALKNRLYGKHFCLTDCDMLTGMSQKDFDGMLDFLRPHTDSNMIFCGDLEPMSQLLHTRWDELDAMLNVRKLNARKFELDECGIIAEVLAENGLDAEGSGIEAAWKRYRHIRGGADIRLSMEHFIERTRFAHYENMTLGVTDDFGHVTRDDFAWISSEDELPESADPNTPRALAELDEMVGLAKVKRTVNNMISHSLISQRKEKAGLGVERPAYTFLMLGAPGTGKTTVAMLLGRIFRELGLLKSGHVVTAGRADLVGAYLGHTALKTTELFNRALGGVLFVDEAYSITAGDHADTYGHEVLATFAQLMTEHIGEICVIFAGYDRPMQNMLDANPGLRHRFAYTLNFEDYSSDEMRAIFDLKSGKKQLAFEPGCTDMIYSLIDRVTKAKTDNFANGRVIDNILQYITEAQENRLAALCRNGAEPTPIELSTITPADCETAFANDAVKSLSKDGKRRVGF